jgi:hypothetical protein
VSRKNVKRNSNFSHQFRGCEGRVPNSELELFLKILKRQRGRSVLTVLGYTMCRSRGVRWSEVPLCTLGHANQYFDSIRFRQKQNMIRLLNIMGNAQYFGVVYKRRCMACILNFRRICEVGNNWCDFSILSGLSPFLKN